MLTQFIQLIAGINESWGLPNKELPDTEAGCGGEHEPAVISG